MQRTGVTRRLAAIQQPARSCLAPAHPGIVRAPHRSDRHLPSPTPGARETSDMPRERTRGDAAATVAPYVGSLPVHQWQVQLQRRLQRAASAHTEGSAMIQRQGNIAGPVDRLHEELEPGVPGWEL